MVSEAEVEGQPFLDCRSGSTTPPLESPLHSDCRYDNGQKNGRKEVVMTAVLVFLLTSCVWATGILIFLCHELGTKTVDTSSAPATAIASSSNNNHSLFDQEKTIYCGTNMQEAQENCIYDIELNTWVPHACADPASVLEYQQADPVSWLPFVDANHTEPLHVDGFGTIDQLNALGHRAVYHTNLRDHVVHCAMLWRRQFRAFAEGRQYVDSVVGTAGHAMHCSQYLIDMTDKFQDLRTIPIEVEVGVASCLVRSEGN